MALSERTINKHNIRRAEVFKQHGLATLDIQYAHPKFAGYALQDVDCTLCGHRHIKWLFSIKFDVPSGIVALAKVFTDITRDKEVTLHPVGSKCITDWLQALPETAEKLEALKRWHVEMEVCKRAMTSKVVEDLCLQAGYESPQDAFEVYQGVSLDARYRLKRKEYKQLSNNAYGIRNKRSSRGTVKTWLANLALALQCESERYAPRQQDAAVAVAPVPAGPRLSDEDHSLLERGRVAWANRSKLQGYHQQAFASMGKQARQANGFISKSQRGFYADLLKRME